jgi:hypothetical protein
VEDYETSTFWQECYIIILLLNLCKYWMATSNLLFTWSHLLSLGLKSNELYQRCYALEILLWKQTMQSRLWTIFPWLHPRLNKIRRICSETLPVQCSPFTKPSTVSSMVCLDCLRTRINSLNKQETYIFTHISSDTEGVLQNAINSITSSINNGYKQKRNAYSSPDN